MSKSERKQQIEQSPLHPTATDLGYLDVGLVAEEIDGDDDSIVYEPGDGNSDAYIVVEEREGTVVTMNP